MRQIDVSSYQSPPAPPPPKSPPPPKPPKSPPDDPPPPESLEDDDPPEPPELRTPPTIHGMALIAPPPNPPPPQRFLSLLPGPLCDRVKIMSRITKIIIPQQIKEKNEPPMLPFLEDAGVFCGFGCAGPGVPLVLLSIVWM